MREKENEKDEKEDEEETTLFVVLYQRAYTHMRALKCIYAKEEKEISDRLISNIAIFNTDSTKYS